MRRKQPHGTDGQHGEERQSLLSGSSDTIHIDSITPRIGSLVDDSNRTVNTSNNHIYNRNNFETAGLINVGSPIPRRTRNKSPDSSYAFNALTSRSTSSYDRGDNYELNQVDGGSHSRIDISGVQSSKPKTDFIEYTILPGDTLHNLSVRYSCPIAAIKRLNNLWSDQEFFGLSKIKLPVGKLRLLAEAINEEQSKHSKLGDRSPIVNYITDKHEVTNSIIQNNNHPTGVSKYAHPAAIQKSSSRPSLLDELNSDIQKELTDKISSTSIFKNLDLSIEKARTAAKSYDDNANDIMQTLAQSGNIVDLNDDQELSEANLVARREAEILFNNLSDYGLSFNILVLVIFIVCLVLPLAYVIYLEETHHDTQNKWP